MAHGIHSDTGTPLNATEKELVDTVISWLVHATIKYFKSQICQR